MIRRSPCVRTLAAVLLGLVPVVAADPPARANSGAGWPAAGADSRPWTRWWWLGSAVDEPGLTWQLEQLAGAGFGGVEICPIYGAMGWEDRYVPFLSPRFVELLGHTARETRRLDLRWDLTTGTGWPFGGPNVSAADASSGLVLEKYELAAGERLARALPEGRVLCVQAVGDGGERVPLTDRVSERRTLDWTPPAGRWRVYVALARGPLQQVKRAAPGGEGNVLDPFSSAALERYLRRFDDALAGWRDPAPRAQFHDSFEYYGASWTPALFDEFAKRRGYDLRDRLPELAGDGEQALVARVRSDYRETLSDLHLAYLQRWTAWAHGHGSLSRNQAHGAPGDLVDLYAAADIPETELFGAPDERRLPLLKLASSAAHVAGRPLASAEAFTWLGEHFQVTLAQAREAADWLFLAGVNQLVFHGVPYSPREAPWPGWQFYAAVNFGPSGGLWRDLPELTAYITRCQSVLQSGEPGEDVLLYYPVHDVWHDTGALVMPSPIPAAFESTALALWRHGYAWDAVSDRLLRGALVADGRVRLGSGSYRTIVVPRVTHMPVDTARRLLDLAAAGAEIVLVGDLPSDVPGLGDLDARRSALRGTLAPLAAPRARGSVVGRHVGRGTVWLADDANEALARAGARREPMADLGLSFVRRRDGRGWLYFVVNRGAAPIESWLELGEPAGSVVRLDPLREDAVGALPVRSGTDGRLATELRLQPGQSAVLRALASESAPAPPWPVFEPAGAPVALEGPWSVRFVEGGPVLPASFETRTLGSWTAAGDEEAVRFAGTALYSTRFARPAEGADDWELDLGRVAETARVRVNGRPLGVAWCPPFRLRVGSALRPGANTLEIEVTNLAANRVRDLDRRGERWKYFHDANVVGRDYKPLDAGTWPVRESGLLGPVTLRALRRTYRGDVPGTAVPAAPPQSGRR